MVTRIFSTGSRSLFLPSNLFIAFLLSVGISLSHADLKNPANGYVFPDWQVQRVQYWSSDAPITNIVESLPKVKQYTEQILKHLEVSEKKILEKLEKQVPPSPGQIVPCKSNYKAWKDSIYFYIGARGLPFPSNSCITEFSDSKTNDKDGDNDFPYTAEELFEAAKGRGRIMLQKGSKNIQNLDANFSRPDFSFNYTYATPDQSCTLHPMAAIRIGRKWYLFTAFTNHPKEISVGDKKRRYVEEAIRINGDKVETAKMTLIAGPDGPDSNLKVNTSVSDATTALELWQGVPEPSSFKKLVIDQNPAVLQALEDGEFNLQQVADALAKSNIAILILPLALNLVPIAAITPVSTLVTILYTLMSDVLTVFPIGIKGKELIDIANKKSKRVHTRISSEMNGKLSNSKLAVAEVWVAECKAESKVKSQGIAFVVTAFVFLVIGIAGELIAKHYATKRRKRKLARLISLRRMGHSNNSSNHSVELGVNGGHNDELTSGFKPQFMRDNKTT